MSPDFTLGNLYGLLGVIFIYFRNNSYISSFQHHLLGVGERFILCLVLGFLKFEHSASRGKEKTGNWGWTGKYVLILPRLLKLRFSC